MKVRALGNCRNFELQEFARIIFIDDFETHSPKLEDHEPLAERPNYFTQENEDSLKSVSWSTSEQSKVYYFYHVVNIQNIFRYYIFLPTFLYCRR